MMNLLRLRLFMQAKVALAAWLFLMAVSLKFPDVATVFSLIIIFAGMAIHQSQWYLILPCSRAKLLALYYLETILVFIFTSCLILLFHRWVSFLTKEPDDVWWFIVAYGIFIVGLRGCAPLTNPAARIQFSSANFFHSKTFRIFGLFGLALCLLFFLGMSVLWLAAVILLLCFIPYHGAKALVLPQQTLRVWRWRCAVASLGTFTAIILSCVYAIHYSPNVKLVDRSMDILLPFLVRPSPERLQELARSPDMTSSRIFSGVRLSDQEWTDRTTKCESGGCLGLSDQLVPETLSIDDRLQRFEVMMSRCQPTLRDSKRVKCLGPNLYGKRLEFWLDVLFSSGKINEWLSSPSATKNFVAIRAFALRKATSEQTTLIESLSKSSPDAAVRRAAELQIQDYGPAMERNEPCRNCSASDLF